MQHEAMQQFLGHMAAAQASNAAACAALAQLAASLYGPGHAVAVTVTGTPDIAAKSEAVPAEPKSPPKPAKTEKPKAAKAPPAEEPKSEAETMADEAPADADGDVYTERDLRDAVVYVQKNHSRDTVIELLDEHADGKRAAKDIDPAKYGAVIGAAAELGFDLEAARGNRK